MADRGHELTEEILKEIEDRCKDEYETAAREMRKKYRDYMAKFERERKAQYELWKSGKITQKEYTNWVYRHTMIGKRWEQMANTLAEDMHHTNEIAHGIANGQLPDIFALNANYGTYQIEHDGRLDTGFTLYNHDTAAYLMEDQQLMPGPSTRKAKEIAANKDKQWNYRKIQSAVLQGVLQGEGPYEVAKRLTGVAQMNYNAAVRYARTMGTNAQNAGRYESYHRAKRLGVDLKIEWSATLDSRTRHEHRLLDGQRREVDEPFEVDGVKIMWPAQSSGPGSSDIPQSLVWNCRCTLLAWVKGFEGETVKSSPKMGKMSYDEWQHAKEPKKQLKSSKGNDNIASGVANVDITARNIYDNLTGQDYDVSKNGTAKLRQQYRSENPDGSYGDMVTEVTGTYTVPENDSDGVIAFGLPSGSKKFGAFDVTQNTIMTDGRIALRKYSANNDPRKNVADIVENEMFVLTGDRRSGLFYRVMNTDKGVEHLKSGKIRPSVNHMTGKKESGLSVWEIPKYGGGKIAVVTGQVIDTGSDGEPVLDVKTVKFVRVLTDEKEMRERAIKAFCKEYHWTEQQVLDALSGKVKVVR